MPQKNYFQVGTIQVIVNKEKGKKLSLKLFGVTLAKRLINDFISCGIFCVFRSCYIGTETIKIAPVTL